LPAHLFPRIFWLSLAEMETFENCYKPWLDTLYQYEQKKLVAEGDAGLMKKLDQAAQKVRSWLEQQTPSTAYWI